MKRWGLIESGFQSGAFNMALDEALFQATLDENDYLPTLRVYGFRRPTITYGYFQKLPDHWSRDPFYDSARRITGGGLVFHGKDLTYSFVSNTSRHKAFHTLRGSYEAFHGIVRDAFARMGVLVEFANGKTSGHPLEDFCFLKPVKDDLLYEGKKIAGAAQKRSRGVFLHQGSVNFRAFIKNDEEYPEYFRRFRESFLAVFREFFQVDFIVQSWDTHGRDESNFEKTPVHYPGQPEV